MLETQIPWGRPYIGREEREQLLQSVDSGWVSQGPKVEQFEAALADYVGSRHAVAVSSGTAALDVALKAIGVEPGDEVIVPAMTYIATANAVRYQHATPVLADIEADTYNIDPDSVREKITDKTVAILAMDYGGQCADYDSLNKIADENDLSVVADAAESLSAKQHSARAGSLADVSITSFHAAKLITSAEGGMVFTDDEELHRRAKIVRNQGEAPDEKYRHVLLGHNYRMTDLHAAIGLAQFDRIDKIVEKRSTLADRYTEALQKRFDIVGLPNVKPKNDHAWFLYPIVLSNRDEVKAQLEADGISTRITWPDPVHQQPMYRETFEGERYPVAEWLSRGVLSLPMFYEMTETQQVRVISSLENAIENHVEKAYELV